MINPTDMTVAVLYGGTSPEREISLRSGQTIADALKQAGFNVRLIDTGPIDEQTLLQSLRGSDVVFPVLHGVGGEDGSVQKWLEEHHFRYVGADPTASALCMDKSQYKEAVRSLDIAVPDGEAVNSENFKQSRLLHRPFVLKPIDGGSSVDTFIVREPGAVDLSAMSAAVAKYGQMLIEELIDGIEITVGVVTDHPLGVIEIIPPADGEFDYENKYNGKTLELCPPEHVSIEAQHEAQALALRISRELYINDISRTDMIVRKGDNKLIVLETNTIPGMTNQSLLPKSAAVAGFSMPKLATSLVMAALAR